jgi:16S rRNA (adenine1518-N6/adenine1519-N6)-dimethyltransferase
MSEVRAKKHLGQHFLKDSNTARRVADALTGKSYSGVLEIGPGTGVLTEFLLEKDFENFRVIELDSESVEYLKKNYRDLEIIEGDFLRYDLGLIPGGNIAIIGNFPYNISSQIFFRVLENRDRIVEVAGMLQKEVAERICSGPGSKSFGILSVLLQAYFKTEDLFKVPANVFHPVPKVESAVIRITRSREAEPDCDEKLFFRVVKTVFNQRRKMIRNSLKPLVETDEIDSELLSMRPEQLEVKDFYSLTRLVEERMN